MEGLECQAGGGPCRGLSLSGWNSPGLPEGLLQREGCWGCVGAGGRWWKFISAVGLGFLAAGCLRPQAWAGSLHSCRKSWPQENEGQLPGGGLGQQRGLHLGPQGRINEVRQLLPGPAAAEGTGPGAWGEGLSGAGRGWWAGERAHGPAFEEAFGRASTEPSPSWLPWATTIPLWAWTLTPPPPAPVSVATP